VPPQLVCGAGHAQLPAWQVDPPAQGVLQLPQWLSSDDRLEQEPEHRVGVAEGQPEPHPNVLPTGPQLGAWPPHAVVQDPQWAGADRSVSHPSLGFAEQ
jgi:hypothetical protein